MATLVVISITPIFLIRLLQQRTVAHAQQEVTVAGAQADFTKAQQRFDRLKRITNSAEHLIQQTGLTNTIIDAAITRIAAAEVKRRDKELIAARFVATVASNIVAADHCIRSCNDFNEAQEATAALNLSGLKTVIIRPTEQERFQLLVPQDSASNALRALDEVRVSCVLTSADPMSANQHALKLKVNGIEATSRLLKSEKTIDATTRLTGIFVRRADEASARAIIEGAAGGK